MRLKLQNIMTGFNIIESAYRLDRERYLAFGVNADQVLRILAKVPVSLPCWLGDDGGGFENFGVAVPGGIVAMENYPGQARTPNELRGPRPMAPSVACASRLQAHLNHKP